MSLKEAAPGKVCTTVGAVMSMRPSAPPKRPLHEVLHAGLLREEPDAGRLGTEAQYDVLDSRGAPFGVCDRVNGVFLYREPRALRGVEVTKPMQVASNVNSARLAVSLSGVLSAELGR